MTKKELIEFLESYQKIKNMEKITIATINEMESNINTIKKLNCDSIYSQKSNDNDVKKIYPNDAICLNIANMKDNLARGIYSNTIRLSKIEDCINAIAFEDIRLGTCLCFRYITGLTNVQIAKEFRYSESSVKIFIKEGINKLYEQLKDTDVSFIYAEISKESDI